MRAALILVLALLAWPPLVLAHEAADQEEQRLPTIGAAPDFALTSQDGAEVTLAIAARQGRRHDLHLYLVPRHLPDAHRQDGAGAGRAGRRFRQQGRLRLDHRRSGARHARGAERSMPRPSTPTSPAGAFSPARRRRCARWRTATASRSLPEPDGQVDHTLLTTLVDRRASCACSISAIGSMRRSSATTSSAS